MDRYHELEDLRRSLAMLPAGAQAGLSHEDAMRLMREVQDLDQRLRRLRDGLARLLDQDT